MSRRQRQLLGALGLLVGAVLGVLALGWGGMLVFIAGIALLEGLRMRRAERRQQTAADRVGGEQDESPAPLHSAGLPL